MVAQDRDTLSASLHAAAALLYPFRWHHIYLPFLPHNLKVNTLRNTLLLYIPVPPCPMATRRRSILAVLDVHC